jgi:hypothetical protein
MTGVKTKLSYPEWAELLEPYGWADITTRSPAMRFGKAGVLEWQFGVQLKAGPGTLGEWEQRAHLLDQARQLIDAVRAAGYWLREPPRIEFGGEYLFRMGDEDPSWFAEAELRFEVDEYMR